MLKIPKQEKGNYSRKVYRPSQPISTNQKHSSLPRPISTGDASSQPIINVSLNTSGEATFKSVILIVINISVIPVTNTVSF